MSSNVLKTRQGGTGLATPGANGNVLTSNGTDWVSSAGGGGGVTTVTGTAPLASSGGTTPDISLTGTVSVSHGGTGAATLAANALLVGAGTGAVTTIPPSTSGNVLTSNGTTWTSAAPAATGSPARPALVGTETIYLPMTDASSPLTNSGSAGGTLAHFGGTSEYQLPGWFGTSARSNQVQSTFAGWTGVTVDPPGTGYTVSVWFIPSGDPLQQVIFEKPNSNTGGVSATSAFIFLDSNSKPTVGIDLNTGSKSAASTRSLPGWQVARIDEVWDGATLSLYVNGCFDASSAAVGTLLTYVTTWNVGGRPASAGTPFTFTGRILDVRLVPSVLSAATIASQWKTGMGLNY